VRDIDGQSITVPVGRRMLEHFAAFVAKWTAWVTTKCGAADAK
jgi:hypothetical protein